MQQDGQQEGCVLDALDRVQLSRSEVDELSRREFLRLAKGGEGDPPFQAMHGDLAGGPVLDDLACSYHEADDLDSFGLQQRAGFSWLLGPLQAGERRSRCPTLASIEATA